MTSRPWILLLPARIPTAMVFAILLSMMAPGPASAALPPCGGGGRIVNLAATLSLSDCSISGNSTSGSGGGVENHADLVLNNVTISANSAGLDGGGIYNAGTLTLADVAVTGNMAGEFGGGIVNDGGTVFMSNVTVTGNTAALGGGGMANISGGSAIGAELAVTSNTATAGDGGGILNGDGSSFCLSSGSDFGACFASPGGGDSLVAGNHASSGNGGGIANDGGSVALSDSTVDGNHADRGDGGGIWNLIGTTGIVNVTISHNIAAGNGAGLFNATGFVCCGAATQVNAFNLTISGNRAGGIGGGVYTTSNGFTALGNSTIADNVAPAGGGGVDNDDASNAFTALQNTLLARNGVNCAGTILSNGSNLDTGTTCVLSGGGDQSNVGDASVGLGTLTANGGPTQGSSVPFAPASVPMMTQTLDPTSPAVDAGGGFCPATDERGIPRPQDGNHDCVAACDIGAFELTASPKVTCVPSVNPSGKNIPPAGGNPKSGQNPDGFYMVTATECGPATIVITIGGYTLAQGETIKITQAPGQSGVRLVNTMGPLNIKHFQVGPGDAVIKATDGAGHSSTVVCLVPPPPK